MSDDFDKIMRILIENEDVPFVKRILDARDFPTLDNEDGSYSTHSMSWSDDGSGRYFVYPTVVPDKSGLLQRLDPDAAVKSAQSTKNFIELGSADEADYFSKNYKSVWGETSPPWKAIPGPDNGPSFTRNELLPEMP